MTTPAAILRPAHRDDWLLIGIGVAAFAAVLITVCRPWDLQNAFMIGAPFGRDVANFWLGGKLAVTGRLDLLVDLRAYNELFSTTFHHNPEEWFVFSYPPHSLLLIAPFAWLPYPAAVTLWTGLNLYGIAQATRLMNREWRWAGIACLSPAVLTMVAFGHFGGLLAFLATYALTRAKAQPALSGVCLALISVKPQFAVVFGLFLLCTGGWRAVLWSVPAGLALGALSVAVFGLKPWVNFFEWTVPFHADLLTNYRIEALRTAVSVYAGARMAGLGYWPAEVAQAVFAVLTLWRAVVLFNRQGPTPRAVAFALFAALAALPYFNGYDLAIMAPAMTLALFDRETSAAPALNFVPALLLWVAPAFALPFGLMAWPVVPALLAAVLLLALFGGPASPPQRDSIRPQAAPLPMKGATAP